MLLLYLILIIFLIIPFCFHNVIYKKYIDDRIEVVADDNNVYYVRNTENSKETANVLANLNSKTLVFISKLENDNSIQEFLPVVKRIKKRYNPRTLSESKIQEDLTSYTINKGESISLCVRTRDTHDKLYNDNILFGVLVHELSHVGSIGVDHGPEFVKNFDFLLKKAVQYGMFKKIIEPFNYCGLETTI
jgi:hypothetical protein